MSDVVNIKPPIPVDVSGVSDVVGDILDDLSMVVGTVQTMHELCLKKGGREGFMDNIEPEAVFGFVKLLEHHLSKTHKGLEAVQERLNPGADSVVEEA